MSNKSIRSRLYRFALFLCAWFFIAGLAALAFVSHLPKTLFGWALFIALAPPVYYFGEIAAEWYERVWPERSLLQKSLKALALILAGLTFAIVLAWLGSWNAV
jgi:hypothetical protein